MEDLERVQRVNYLGVLYTLKAGLPGMLQRRSGVVLMMSSMMAMFGEKSAENVSSFACKLVAYFDLFEHWTHAF